jgi:hypothetical protein
MYDRAPKPTKDIALTQPHKYSITVCSRVVATVTLVKLPQLLYYSAPVLLFWLILSTFRERPLWLPFCCVGNKLCSRRLEPSSSTKLIGWLIDLTVLTLVKLLQLLHNSAPHPRITPSLIRAQPHKTSNTNVTEYISIFRSPNFPYSHGSNLYNQYNRTNLGRYAVITMTVT